MKKHWKANLQSTFRVSDTILPSRV